MADVLNMQDDQPQDTPGAEKASNVSLLRWCNNSYISVSVCMVK
ncbi:hypothetical protein [Luteococcus sp.]